MILHMIEKSFRHWALVFLIISRTPESTTVSANFYPKLAPRIKHEVTFRVLTASFKMHGLNHQSYTFLFAFPISPWQTQHMLSDFRLWPVSRYRLIDHNGREFETLAHKVKNLIETWQDLSVSHKEARTLIKDLEVTNILCNLNMFHLKLRCRNFPILIMNMHTSLAHFPLSSVCELPSVQLLS